jgi:dihydrofolate reductase
MRKVMAGLAVSMDGVVESPSDWQTPMNAEMAATMSAGVAESDTVVLGRRTYLRFAELWPAMGSGTPMAAFLNSAPKYVVSSTLSAPADWANSELVTDLAGLITRLKTQPGRNILIPGSPRVVRSLVRDGLLDELALFIHPVVVGTGMRLFEDMTDRRAFALLDSRPLGDGVQSMTYRPLGA